MSDYLDKIQTQKKDGTPLATVPFRDSAAREDITTIQNELTTDTTTIEGNPLNFTTLSAQTAKSTILSVEPIQDLHGYDYPWVGGAGKNKCPKGVTSTINGVTFTVQDNGEVVVSGTANATTFWGVQFTIPANAYILNGCPNGGGDSTYILTIRTSVGGSEISGIGYDSGNGSRFTITEELTAYLNIRIGNGYSAPTGGLKLSPMIRLSTETDSTFAPYTNICPISGRTEIGILGEGKNLYIGSPSFDGYTNIENWTQDSSTHNGNKVYKRQYAWSGTFKYITLPVGTYTFSCYAKADDNSHACVIYILDENTTATITRPTYSEFVISNTWNRYSYTFNVTSAGTVALRFESKTSSDSNYIYISEYQLEKGNQATTFEPYTKSNDLTISLGQTVYGGTLDVENGVLVATDKILDLSTLSWSLWSNNRWYGAVLSDSILYDNSQTANAISDRFVSTSANTLYADTSLIAFAINHDKELLIRNGSTTDAPNVGQICYKLATPITINLTPNTINLLKGVNNISTDGDNITLTYREGEVATLGDLTSAVDSLDGKIEDSKILTDTATGDKYILVVTNGVLSVEQISN